MDTKRKTIWLVDDDAASLEVGCNAIRGYYNVLTLDSGEKLLQALEKNTPDLILLDVAMPEMNGYDVIKCIKSDPATAHIPVIFLTAKSDVESEFEGLSLGAVDYIVKPFFPLLLRKRIEIHLLVETQKQELVHFNHRLLQMVEARIFTVLELRNAILKTIAELVECRDDVTGSHIDRTQKYLRIFFDELQKRGMYKEETDSWDIDLVLLSAQLHDVGKIAIKDGILKKPARLTDEEFEEIKIHSVFGAKVIDKIGEHTTDKEFLEYAKIFACTHHEKWDGSGYPNGLKGEEIPLLGRIMAIVDVYDALISERPYKRAFTHEESVSIIVEGSGRHFDPVMVDVFLGVAEEFEAIGVGG